MKQEVDLEIPTEQKGGWSYQDEHRLVPNGSHLRHLKCVYLSQDSPIAKVWQLFDDNIKKDSRPYKTVHRLVASIPSRISRHRKHERRTFHQRLG